MYARHNADDDGEPVLPLPDPALAQFRKIGMTGRVKRGDDRVRRTAR